MILKILLQVFVFLFLASSLWATPMQGDGVSGAIDEALNTRDEHLTATSSFAAMAGLVFYDGFIPDDDISITKVSIYAASAPTGADMIIDLVVNGVAQGRLATLADGTQNQQTDITDLDVNAGQRVGLKFTQAGSAMSGNGVQVTFHYNTRD